MSNRDERAIQAMILAGVLPSAAEAAVKTAAQQMQGLPTAQEMDEDAANPEAEASAAWWLMNRAVPTEYKRLLHARTEGPEPAEFGGPGSGNYEHEGIPGQVGGSKGGPSLPQKVRLSRHAFQRMGERHLYGAVKKVLKKLEGKQTPEDDWYMTMRDDAEQVHGYLVGMDGVVKTVLGSWYNPSKLRGPDMATLSLWPVGLIDLGGPKKPDEGAGASPPASAQAEASAREGEVAEDASA